MDIDEIESEEKRTATDVIEEYPFSEFCKFLERCNSFSKHNKKRELCERLWKNLKESGGKDFYPLMRLLLPQIDMERPTYQIKEKTIGNLYIRAIPLPKNSKEAKKLIHYKNPTYSGLEVGDFTNCLFAVLKPRCISISNAKKSIFDVNHDLLKLQSECHTQQSRTQWFQMLMNAYTATEQKWLMRIILKDLKCGIKHESCLKNFDSDAWQIYNQTSSLRKVCATVADPNRQRHNGRFLQIELFSPVKPMLASRRHWNQVTKVMNGPFGIEIKFDGERVMIHYRKTEDRVMFWSRNSIDLEKKYGYVQSFGDVIKRQFKCESCIIDGEMMSFDEEIGAFIPFGSNRTVASNDNRSQHLCYMAFDILMVDDNICMDLTLSARRALLKEAFVSKKSYFEPTKLVTGISDTKGIMNALDNALVDHNEGIMVKALNSVYECNKRGNDWIKLKPDYVDDMVSSLDLIVLGGYFGEGKRRVGDVSHFLLGCRQTPFYTGDNCENSKEEMEMESDSLPSEFYTFCKVGSGYKIEELRQLQTRLRPHWHPFNRNAVPPHFLGWKPGPGEVPDCWIEPRESVICELLANEIISTDKFRALLTVRFPRCKKFRYDKPWFECVSLPEIREKFKNKNSHRIRTAAEIALFEEDTQPKKKRKLTRARKAPSIMDKFRPADVSGIETQSHIFEEKEFCVLNGMECSDDYDLQRFTKQELERLIVAHCGIITQNPILVSTNYLIAERLTPRVNNIIECNTNVCNIIKPLWIIQSIENQRILPLAPTFMVYSTNATLNLLQKSFDCYGDHFARATNVESLKQVFMGMKSDSNGNDLRMSDSEELRIVNGWNRFKRCTVYIDYFDPVCVSEESESECRFKWSSSLRLIEKRVRLYGGNVSKYLDCNVTHVIVENDDYDRPRLRAINKRISAMMSSDEYQWRPYLVTKKWVIDSIRSERAINNCEKYAPRKLSFPQ